jgi:hypothetical protein
MVSQISTKFTYELSIHWGILLMIRIKVYALNITALNITALKISIWEYPIAKFNW